MPDMNIQSRAFCRLRWYMLAAFSPNHLRDVVSRWVRVRVGLTTGLRLLESLSVTRAHPFTTYTMAFHIFPQYMHRSFTTQPLQVMRGRPSSQSLYRSSSSCSSPQSQEQPSQTFGALFLCFYLPPSIPYRPCLLTVRLQCVQFPIVRDTDCFVMLRGKTPFEPSPHCRPTLRPNSDGQPAAGAMVAGPRLTHT